MPSQLAPFICVCLPDLLQEDQAVAPPAAFKQVWHLLSTIQVQRFAVPGSRRRPMHSLHESTEWLPFGQQHLRGKGLLAICEEGQHSHASGKCSSLKSDAPEQCKGSVVSNYLVSGAQFAGEAGIVVSRLCCRVALVAIGSKAKILPAWLHSWSASTLRISPLSVFSVCTKTPAS